MTSTRLMVGRSHERIQRLPRTLVTGIHSLPRPRDTGRRLDADDHRGSGAYLPLPGDSYRRTRTPLAVRIVAVSDHDTGQTLQPDSGAWHARGMGMGPVRP